MNYFLKRIKSFFSERKLALVVCLLIAFVSLGALVGGAVTRIGRDVTIERDLILTANIKDGSRDDLTIYNATTGKMTVDVMPFKRGAITSDWETTVYDVGFYDVSNLSVDNVAEGVSYGRGQTGTKGSGSPFLQSAGLPTYYTGDEGWWADASRKGVSYVNNGDGTVSASSGLMWWRCTHGRSGSSCESGSATPVKWATALDTCHASTMAGYTDWRLPTVGELYSLFTGFVEYRYINTTAFPNTSMWSYWSSSTYLLATSQAWRVNYATGETDQYLKGDISHSMLCVRG